MGAIEETRQLIQDFLTPELRAIGTKLESIEKRLDRFEQEVDRRFTQIEKRFEQVDRRFEQVDTRFEQADKRFEEFERRIEQKFQDADKRAADRYDNLQLSLGSLTNYNLLRERMLSLEQEAVRRRELELERQSTHQ